MAKNKVYSCEIGCVGSLSIGDASGVPVCVSVACFVVMQFQVSVYNIISEK